jgi:hypothetical protein
VEQVIPQRPTGLQGYLPRPFWGMAGNLAVFCGTLASNQMRWDGEGVLILVQILLLTNLAWGSVWSLTAGIDWFQPLAEGWPPSQSASVVTLPYTQSESPVGRFSRWLGRALGWWRGEFWPATGLAAMGLLTASVLTIVLVVILPESLRPLNVMFVALVGLGIVQHQKGRSWPAGQALVSIGLGWLAGQVAFAKIDLVSLAVVSGFVLAASGALRIGEGLAGGAWLLVGGQVSVIVLLIFLRQPLAAVSAGILLFCQMVMVLSIRFGGDPNPVSRRIWPWFMIAMLVAAWAVR